MRIRKLAVVTSVAAGCLTFAASGSAAVRVWAAAWFWGNPTPQGQTLSAVDFAQGRGYAAGAAGALLRTDDGGSTWSSPVTFGTLADIERLDVIDAQTVVVLASQGCSLRRSDDGGVLFRSMFITAEYFCSDRVHAVTFVDRMLGYLLLQNGSVVRTTDGGHTFTTRTALPGTQASSNATGDTAADIAFPSPDTGIGVVSSPQGGPSKAFRTTDGGNSWIPVTGFPAGSVRRLYVFDAQTLFAVGPDTLLTSDDGGTTWNAAPAAAGHDLTSIRCADRRTCLLTTAKGDVLLRTTDGGQTATATTPSSRPMLAAAFSSPTDISAVGADGAIVVSKNGGVDYSPVSRDIGGNYARLRPGPTPSSAFAAGDQGRLAMTVDGGASWTALAVPTSLALADVAFSTPTTGYALGSDGSLYRTTNTGATWAVLDTGSTAPSRSLVALPGDSVVLVGPRGIRRATAPGRFDPVGEPAVGRASLSDVVATPGAVVTAVGAGTKNVFVSSDGAMTWDKIALPPRMRVFRAEFVSARVGFLVTSTKRLFKTIDGGATWRELFAGTNDIDGISMSSPSEGFLSLSSFGGGVIGTLPSDAHVLRTTDGGRTWHPHDIAPGVSRSVVTTGSGHAYDLVGDRGLFFTKTGGDDGTALGVTLRARVQVLTAQALRSAGGKVVVTGSIGHSGGGEFLVVSRRDLSGTKWTHQAANAGANGGTFTTTWKIKRTSVFVAQLLGGGGRRSDGSPPLVVKVEPRRVRRRP